MAAVLYGATGGSVASQLYTVDPATGATVAVGPTGYAITGMAQHPSSAVMYGVTSRLSPASPLSLISLDLTTGAGTLIGSTLLGANIGDIAFRADGVLFGWATNARRLVTLNISTGAATYVGPAQLVSQSGGGLAFDSSGVLYVFPEGSEGDFYTVNPATGVVTVAGTLSGAPPDVSGFSIGAAAYPANFVNLYAAITVPAPDLSELVTITLVSGRIRALGALPSNFDALAWTGTGGPPPVPPAASLVFDGGNAFRVE